MTLTKSYRLPQLTEVPRFEGDAGEMRDRGDAGRCGTGYARICGTEDMRDRRNNPLDIPSFLGGLFRLSRISPVLVFPHRTLFGDGRNNHQPRDSR
jgi:hypothetical protein